MKKYAYVVAPMILVGCREHADHGSAPASSSPVATPVQHEMRLLTTALEAAVRGIGAGDVRAVEHELHGVHTAKEATEAAIRDGRYRPPKSPDRPDRFRELDEAFHRDLEPLVDASHRNDVGGTAEALGVVLRGCHGCHTEFRR